jgi:hypothetical protein
MGNGWEMDGKWMGNGWEMDGKWMGNVWELWEFYIILDLHVYPKYPTQDVCGTKDISYRADMIATYAKGRWKNYYMWRAKLDRKQV